jgi:ubiquinone/menaquinone biosynthesis C-methylase UbiE
MQPAGPNAAMIEYWNDAGGRRWVALAEATDAEISPLGLEAMEHLGVAAGERVLDVGCGCGQSTLQLAARVGASGAVLGVDISRPMLERARDRAVAAGVRNARFEMADAQTFAFEPEAFDVAFSRFGVMFFADPGAAFANLRRALRIGGRLGFVAWQELARNPCHLEPMRAVAPLLGPPAPADPHAPGPFALADAERVRAILQRAGFDEVRVEALERELHVGADLDAAAGYLVQIGPTGRALREASEGLRAQARERVRAALAPFATPDGVFMRGAVWLVSARRGG